MNELKFLKPLWWVLHAAAIALFFLLGHFLHFPPPQ